MPKDEIERLYSDGELLIVSRSFDALYSWRMNDLKRAASARERWMVDFRLPLRRHLLPYSPKMIVVMPPTEEELLMRMRSGNRAERSTEILRELRENYDLSTIEELRAEGALILVADDNMTALAHQVRTFCAHSNVI